MVGGVGSEELAWGVGADGVGLGGDGLGKWG